MQLIVVTTHNVFTQGAGVAHIYIYTALTAQPWTESFFRTESFFSMAMMAKGENAATPLPPDLQEALLAASSELDFVCATMLNYQTNWRGVW